jgi:hypothetical protein
VNINHFAVTTEKEAPALFALALLFVETSSLRGRCR